jgi:SagB-type dehydrogenase family enzyme
MRVKTPQSLVSFPKDDQVIVYNYLTKDVIAIAPNDVYWLTVASRWTTIDEIISSHPNFEPVSLRREVIKLVDAGVLLLEGTPQAEIEGKYLRSWELGHAAGFFHFTTLDNDYGTISDSVAKQSAKNISEPSPDLFWINSGNAYRLPDCKLDNSIGLLEAMQQRRTTRNVLPYGISIQSLADALFTGLGITGFVRTETATLPVKMTPSGGARNPFEAFVWAKNVEGLERGIYHYSAVEHSLQYVVDPPSRPVQDFVQKQEWADDMPCIIFLVAILERVTWKYNDPNAYRVVMIESGHIAQNMMLAASHHRLTACPTAALAHTLISDLLGLSSITQTPIYAICIGHPAESEDSIISVADFYKN